MRKSTTTPSMNPLPQNTVQKREAGYVFVTAVLSVVSDGWSGKPTPLLHQILLLPFAVMFVTGLWYLLRSPRAGTSFGADGTNLPSWWWVALGSFEMFSVLMMVAESRHFRQFGYKLTAWPCIVAISICVLVWTFFYFRQRGLELFTAILVTYTAGAGLALRCFPLNYLRSDMLPVISWADERLVRHLDPYQTMHVGARVYDFPYLPGILVVFLPAQAAHWDLRVATLVYLLGAAALIYGCSLPQKRFETAALLGVFLLCPFLQYRNDLYLEPHWFFVTLAMVLMVRGRFAWSAFVWGISCAIYQLSWVVVPFVFLNAWRRRGLVEAGKLAGWMLVGALLVAGPFLKSAGQQMAHNTVAQWSHLTHALADPINLSYWLTYVIHPDQLRWVQAAVLVTIFVECVWRRRCETLTDTVRWMCVALAVFIPLNILVDGYFYLTLLLFLLFYVLLANRWWVASSEARETTKFATSA